jgi:hypothetical protein
MKRYVLSTVLAIAAIGLTVPGTVHAADRFLFPEDLPGPPIYLAVPENTLGFTDGEWACIPVDRKISGIPLDFNLLNSQDNVHAQSVPLYVQGFVIRDAPPPSPPQTLYIEDTPGKPMPILFVRWSELQAEIADGKLYIDELLAMNSLRVGIAEQYMEEVQVIGGAPVPSHRRIAFGELLDGTPFLATYDHGAADKVPKVQVRIEFGE